MINNFKDNEVRSSAIVYSSTWEQIKKLYARDPAQAGELAIAAFELALTGDFSSDDFMIELLLENIKVVDKKAKDNHDKKVESNRQKKIGEQQLDIIAELYAAGMKQKDIATRLNTTPQTISNRLATIRTDFPELLEKNQAKKSSISNKNQVNQVNQENQDYDNDNDNVNDNLGEICANRTNPSAVSCANAQSTGKTLTKEDLFRKEWGMM